MPLYVVGLRAKSHSVEEREKYALLDQQIIDQNQKLIDEGLITEIVTLSTCNRIEHYFVSDQPLEAVIPGLFRGEFPKDFFMKKDSAATYHLYEVISGLDSKILGENEILGQIKKAYALAQQHKQTGTYLNVLFQKATYVGKRVRTVTDISRCSVSTGGIIIDKVKKGHNNLSEITVLLIGAGEISRNVAISLSQKGVKEILITNRSQERGELLANELNAKYIPINELYEHIKIADVVISSTSAPHYVITKNHEEYLKGASKMMFDLAVPRDIAPEVDELENIELHNIDDISTLSNVNQSKREMEIHKTNQVIALENCKFCLSYFLRETGCPVTGFFNFNKVYKDQKKAVQI